MAITITWKGSVYSTAAGGLTSAPTWAPTPGSLLIACVVQSYASSPLDPTAVSGHGQSYTKLTLGASVLPAASSTHALSIWVAKAGASPTTAAAATTVSGTTAGSAIIEFEVVGAEVSGTALQAIIASTATNIATSGTAETVTLAAAAKASNRALIFAVHLSNTNLAAAGSWTLTAGATGSFNTPATGAGAFFNNSTFDTAGAATGANVGWRMVGIEIAAAPEVTDSPGVRLTEAAFGSGTASQSDAEQVGQTEAAFGVGTGSQVDSPRVALSDATVATILVSVATKE